MICKQCGAQIPDDSEECSFCGAIYEENIKAAEPEDTVNESGAEEALGVEEESDIDEILDENEIKRRKQMERMQEEKRRQLDDIEKRRRDKKAKMRRTRACVAVAAVVAAAGVGTGSYYLWKNHSSGPDIAIATQQPVDDSVIPSASTPLPTIPALSFTPSPDEQTATESPDGTSESGQNWRVADSSADGTSGGGDTSASGTSGTSSDGGSSGGSSADGSTSGTNGGGTAAGGSSGDSANGTTGGGSAADTSGGSSSGGSSSGGSSSAQRTPSGSTTMSGETIALYSSTFSGNEYKAEGGFKNGVFSSALITGMKVVKSGDKTYMQFKFNGAEYYANVSADTTTEYVKDRPMTINAYKTSETYDGHPVYEITTITNYNSEYIFPNSGYELLTEDDLKDKTPLQLLLGRNEIYARHGRKFQNAQIREYFESRSWYRVKDSYNYDDDSSNLNTIERTNADFIKSYEDNLQNQE